jgi:hypothetical protein
MKQLPLICKDKRFPSQGWWITLREDGVFLWDPLAGGYRVSFPRAEAEKRLALPSFAESIMDFGVRTDDGQTLWFQQNKELIAEGKAYLHGALAARGPEAIRALRTQGWLMAVGGAALGLACLFITVATMIAAYASRTGGSYYVLTGGAIFGIIIFSRGVAALRSARRAEEELRAAGPPHPGSPFGTPPRQM